MQSGNADNGRVERQLRAKRPVLTCRNTTEPVCVLGAADSQSREIRQSEAWAHLEVMETGSPRAAPDWGRSCATVLKQKSRQDTNEVDEMRSTQRAHWTQARVDGRSKDFCVGESSGNLIGLLPSQMALGRCQYCSPPARRGWRARCTM